MNAVINANKKNYDPNDEKMKEGCVICLEDFAENDGKAIAELKCGHIFHEECLKEWVQKNDICPMCRSPILQDNDPFAE